MSVSNRTEASAWIPVPYTGFSPVLLSGLMPGIHQLKITPTGCGRNRMNLNIRFSVE